MELLGPCRFGGWAPDGEPIAVPHPSPWVQIAAVSQDQTRNTMTLLPGLLGTPKRAKALGVDLGKTIIYGPGSARLEAVTSNPRALEGSRPSMVILGEALALDTPLPTPTGWVSVADVAVGDDLIGSDGRPTQVRGKTPVQQGRKCYRISFADQTCIVADDGHLWWTRVAQSSAKPRIRTTREIAENNLAGSILLPVMEPLDGPEADFRGIDPYVLGMWLGDGDASSAHLTCGRDDVEFVLTEMKLRGVPAARLTKVSDSRAYNVSLCGNRDGDLYTKDGSSLRAALVRLGVLNNKHVPIELLRGSKRQRLDLLRGLMDSDGYVGTNGHAEFSSQNPALARAAAELLRSLGYKASVRSAVDRRWVSGERIRYRVCFRPRADLNPFINPRKAERVKPGTGQDRWVQVKSVEPVESVDVQCIEVAADDHLFVAGEGWTVTHNTHHWLPSNDGREMARAVARNLAKSRDGSARALAITNAHAPGENSVAEADFEAWLDIDSGKSRASGVLYDSLAAPADLDLSDPVALRAGIKAASGDSWWIDANRIAEEVLDPTTPVSMSRRFYLNQIVAPEDAWISAQEWDRCQIGAQLNPGDMVTLGFDGSRKDDATALVACRVTDGLLVRLGVWVAPLNVTDWEVDRDEVDAAVRSACDAYDVAGFYADLALWESYIDGWRDTVATGVRVKACGHHPLAFDMRGRRADFTRAADRFVSDVQQRQLMHDGDRTLRQHVLNARRAPNRWGVSIRKEAPMSQRKIDAAVASVLAWAARNDVVANGGASTSTKRRPGRVKAFI